MEDNPRVLRSEGSCGENVFLPLETVELRSHAV